MYDTVLLSVASLTYFGFYALLIWKARNAQERVVITALAIGVLIFAGGMAYLFPGQHVHFHTPGGLINHSV